MKKEIKEETKAAVVPEISIGLVGHVDHGKTTLCQALSGKWTDQHSEEIKRGITIKLGYANSAFYKCPACKGTDAYSVKEECPICKSKTILQRKISFVDAPGHETLMATMLSGAAIIDGALLLVSANENCPQPQTKEHLLGLEISNIKQIVIVQNKMDLVSEEEAQKNYEQIKAFVKGTIAEHAPIIPISAQHQVNIPFLIEAIENTIKTPERDTEKDSLMYVARSFDINKPGTGIERLRGGVIGGALKHGILKKGDKIEIRPGIKLEKEGRVVWKPLFTEIEGIHSGEDETDEIGPGCSIALLTKLDPAFTKADNLFGNVVGHPEKMPPIIEELSLKIRLLERVVGSKTELKVDPIKKGEYLMLNVGSAATMGYVVNIAKDVAKMKLKLPICTLPDDKFAVSRMVEHRFRIIGVGVMA